MTSSRFSTERYEIFRVLDIIRGSIDGTQIYRN